MIIHVPASEGPPRRSRKDWRFYLRVGSGTIPMEYFQIADMFGKRPHPKLELFLETGRIGTVPFDNGLLRFFCMDLSNTGRGLAKFPSIRFRRNCGLTVSQFGLDGNGNVGLPTRPDDEWVIFGGGADDVIHPGTTLKITSLLQPASRGDPRKGVAIFDALTFNADVAREATPTTTLQKSISEGRHR